MRSSCPPDGIKGSPGATGRSSGMSRSSSTAQSSMPGAASAPATGRTAIPEGSGSVPATDNRPPGAQVKSLSAITPVAAALVAGFRHPVAAHLADRSPRAPGIPSRSSRTGKGAQGCAVADQPDRDLAGEAEIVAQLQLRDRHRRHFAPSSASKNAVARSDAQRAQIRLRHAGEAVGRNVEQAVVVPAASRQGGGPGRERRAAREPDNAVRPGLRPGRTTPVRTDQHVAHSRPSARPPGRSALRGALHRTVRTASACPSPASAARRAARVEGRPPLEMRRQRREVRAGRARSRSPARARGAPSGWRRSRRAPPPPAGAGRR